MATEPKRIAAIDIGTVTCRLLLAQVENGSLTELERRCSITDLGIGVDKTGVLREDAIERVVAKVAEYLQVLEAYCTPQFPEIPVIAMATSASRDAENADVLVGKLRALGVELSVIEGSREAALSFRGASCGFEGENLMVADIGGGSTEIVLGVGGQAPALAHSFNIGCRRVYRAFLGIGPAVCQGMHRSAPVGAQPVRAVLCPSQATRHSHRPHRCGGGHGHQRGFGGQADGCLRFRRSARH